MNTEVRSREPEFAFFYLLFIALFLMIPALTFAAEEDQVTKIQKAYEGIKDMKGSFVQKSHIKDLKRTDTYKGIFFIKPPNMKWEYTGDKPQVIYVRGGNIVVYQKKLNQVIKAKFDRAAYGRAPLALLAGLGNIREEFDVVSGSPDRLVVKPKDPMGNIEHIEIKPSDGEFPVKSITIVDSLSNRIEITLKDVKTNTGIKNSVFSFTPPKGATVIEQ